MGQGGYDLEDLELDEAVITLIQTDIRHQTSDRQTSSEFFVLYCYRGLSSDGLITTLNYEPHCIDS